MDTRSIVITFTFLVLLLALGIFFFFITGFPLLSPRSTVVSNPTKTSVVSTPTVGFSTPQIIVDTFYQTYVDCIKVPANTCTPRSANVDQEKLQPSYQRNAKYGDPIMCSSSAPQGVHTDGVSPIVEEKATVIVIEDFGGGVTKQLLIGVEIESGTWKVTNITCPN